MKKLRFVSMVLAFAMLLSLLPAQAIGQTESVEDALSDPFAAMYDANEPLLEKLDSTLRESYTDDKPQANALARSIAPEKPYEEQVETLKELVSQGRADELESAEGISAELVERAAAIREDLYQDRYIVKYSSGVNAHSKASVFSGISSEALPDGLELITFDEKTNPAALAVELRNAGMDRYIEYIQPDIMLYPASGGLSLELLEGGDDNPGEGVEESPPEENDEEPGDVTEPAPSEPEEVTDSEEEPSEELTDELTEEASTEVIVALIDTYVDISHPMIADSLWEHPDTGLNGWNFYEDSDVLYDPADAYYTLASHGTHIAGIIAQSGNVKLMVLPVFGKNGARTSDIISAIEYAAENGASVINCSFGSGYYNPALEEALAESGALVVAAAGNGRSSLKSSPVYPASFELDNLISVGSVNDDGGLSYFSNYDVDITAPGRDVASALPEGEGGPMSGTSMSAAYVSAGAAATLAANPGLDTAELRSRIIYSADRLDNLTNKSADGRRLNVANAMAGTSGESLRLNPADDFDVHGYNPTLAESWELFSSSGEIVQVAAGGDYSLVLKDDGTVWSWGYNFTGQLGDGSFIHRFSPVQVIGLADVTYIAAGDTHALAVKDDGTVWGWGNNDFSRLGIQNDYCSHPVQLYLSNIVSASAGWVHSLVVEDFGNISGWGYNESDQLGYRIYNPVIDEPYPVSMDLYNVASTACGFAHSMALCDDGSVYTWGANYSGQLGDMAYYPNTNPFPFYALSDVCQIAAGDNHSMALSEDGNVYTWGDSTYGQLGRYKINPEDPYDIEPGQASISGVASIAAGADYSLAVKTDGTIYAWGDNTYGQLGLANGASYPTKVPNISGITAADGGWRHSIALGLDGSVWTWGNNTYGQLGDGTTENRTTPVKIFGGSGEDKPEWFDEMADFCDNISEEDMRTQDVIDQVFELLEDAVGECEDEIELVGDARDVVIGNLYTQPEFPPSLATASPDENYFSVIAGPDSVTLRGSAGDLDFTITYSPDGTLKKTFSYVEEDVLYVVASRTYDMVAFSSPAAPDESQPDTSSPDTSQSNDTDDSGSQQLDNPFSFQYLYQDDMGYVCTLIHKPEALDSADASWFYLVSDDPASSIGECFDVFTISEGVQYRYSLGYDIGDSYQVFIGIVELIALPGEEPYLRMESDGYFITEHEVENDPNAMQPQTIKAPTTPWNTGAGTASSLTWGTEGATSPWVREYRCYYLDGKATAHGWQTSGTFNGLQPKTGYMCQARYRNTSTRETVESAFSAVLYTAPNPPAKPVVSGTPTTTSIKVTVAAAPSNWYIQYRIYYVTEEKRGDWQNNGGVFNNLTPDRPYQFEARYAGDPPGTYTNSFDSVTSAVIRTKPNPVTITWNYNGGSGSPLSSRLTPGETFGSALPTQASRTGYTFAGWYTSTTGGSKITTTSTVPSSNTTYYARWTAVSVSPVTITWNYNGGSGSPLSSRLTPGETFGLDLPTPNHRTGYIFSGWYTSTTGGSRITTTSTVPSSNTTYYARWSALPGATSITAPAADSIVEPGSTVRLSWNAASGAVCYQVIIRVLSGTPNPSLSTEPHDYEIFRDDGYSTTYKDFTVPTSSAYSGKWIKLYVRAENSAGHGTASTRYVQIRPATPTFTVSPTSWNPSSVAQTSNTFTVVSDAAWSAWSSAPDWLGQPTVREGVSGTTTFTTHVLANPGEERTGTISVSSRGVIKTITVTQAAALKTTSKPSTPVLESRTANSITLKAIAAPSGWAIWYRRITVSTGDTGDWQTSNTFTGLDASTNYKFQVQFKAGNTATHKDSEISTSEIIKTASSDYKLDVSRSTVYLPARGGSTVIEVDSNIEWSISGRPSWLTVSPLSGRRGSTDVTLSTSSTGNRTAEFTVSAGDISRPVTVIQGAPPVIHSFDAYESPNKPAVIIEAELENASEIKVYLNRTPAIHITNHSLARDVYIYDKDVNAGDYNTRLDARNGGDWVESRTVLVTVTVSSNPLLDQVSYIKSYNYGTSHIDNSEMKMSIIKFNNGSFVTGVYSDDVLAHEFYLDKSLTDEMEALYSYADENKWEWWFPAHPDYYRMAKLYEGRTDLHYSIESGFLDVEYGSDEYYACWVICTEANAIQDAYDHERVQMIMAVVSTVLMIVQIGLLVRQYRVLYRAELKAMHYTINVADDAMATSTGNGLFKDGLGDLSGKSFKVTSGGIKTIEEHFTKNGYWSAPENGAMVARLKNALANNQRVTGADASFYLHELRESMFMTGGLEARAAHDAALAYYNVSGFSTYHPDVFTMYPGNFNSGWYSFWGITP